MTDYSKLGERLRAIIVRRLEEGNLSLPAFPKSAAEVQVRLEEPNVDLARISQIIDRDPVFAAQVLKVANSALHRRANNISTVQQAVTHLGARTLKQTLLAAAARQVFTSHDRRINHSLGVLWEHSVAVAMLARNVAGIAGSPDPETAYLAGLLHDIGKAVIAIYLLELERSLPAREALDWIDESAWLAVVNDYHRDVGAAVVRGWQLPAVVVRAVLEGGDYDPTNRLSPINAVLFANALTKREGIYLGAVDHEGVGSLLMIGKSLLGIDDQVVDGLARELADAGLRAAS